MRGAHLAVGWMKCKNLSVGFYHFSLFLTLLCLGTEFLFCLIFSFAWRLDQFPSFLPSFLFLCACAHASVCEYRCVCPQKSVVEVGHLVSELSMLFLGKEFLTNLGACGSA